MESCAGNTFVNILPPTTTRMLLALMALKNLKARTFNIAVIDFYADKDCPAFIE